MTDAPKQQFEIHRLYIKDTSFESPSTPAIFREEWKPTVNIDLQTRSSVLETNLHEVVLTVTATTTLGDKTAFLAEVQQAGIFLVGGFEKEALGQMLGSFCPNLLFPYAREALSDLTVRAGFPPLYLTPVNFDALYAQHLQSQQGSVDGDAKAN